MVGDSPGKGRSSIKLKYMTIWRERLVSHVYSDVDQQIMHMAYDPEVNRTSGTRHQNDRGTLDDHSGLSEISQMIMKPLALPCGIPVNTFEHNQETHMRSWLLEKSISNPAAALEGMNDVSSHPLLENETIRTVLLKHQGNLWCGYIKKMRIRD